MGSSNFTSSLGYHRHHCSCCRHCCHYRCCHCCYHRLGVPILIIAIFNLIIAVFDLIFTIFDIIIAIFDIVIAIFDIVIAVFDIVIVVNVDIVVLFPPNASRMLPKPSTGLVLSRWSLLPSWPSQPLCWEV